MNMYGFVGNDGVNNWDILGMEYLAFDVGGGTAPAYDRDKINNDVYENKTWTFSTHIAVFKLCACCNISIGKDASDALTDFRAWSHGALIDNVGAEVHGNIVQFDRKGIYTGLIKNDIGGMFAGTASTHGVTTSGKGASYDQKAITNEGHIITGVRIWKSWTTGKDSSGCFSLILMTSAFENYNNLGGWLGYTQFSEEAKKLWGNYLKKTAVSVYNRSSCDHIELVHSAHHSEKVGVVVTIPNPYLEIK